MIKSDKIKEEELKEQLVFLLEKEKLTKAEMEWLFMYLEESDEEALKTILYDNFKKDEYLISNNLIKQEDGNLNGLQRKIFKIVFNK